MRRQKVIFAMSVLAGILPLCGCDRNNGKSDSKSSSAHTAEDSLTPAEKAIIGRWQLDRRASLTANLAGGKLHGGLGYEFKIDGTGMRRIGISPADPITWTMVHSSGDSIELRVEEVSSGNATSVTIAKMGPDQIHITDRLGDSILQRTTDDITIAQLDISLDPATMAPAFSVITEPGLGIKLAASRDGTSLIERNGMGLQRNFTRWDMTTHKAMFTINLAGGTILPVAMSADGKLCATADSNGPTIWDARLGNLLHSFAPRPGQGGVPVGLLFSPDAKLIIMAAGRGVIGWNIQTGDEQFSIKVDDISVSAMALFPGGKRLATNGNDTKTKIWNLSEGTLVKTLNPPQENAATAIAISEDGRHLASAHQLGMIEVFDMPDGTPRRTIDPHHSRIESMVFLSDGKSLVHPVHNSTWDLAVTDIESGEVRELLKGHTEEVNSLALSDDGNTLFSAGDDQCIRIWNMKALVNP